MSARKGKSSLWIVLFWTFVLPIAALVPKGYFRAKTQLKIHLHNLQERSAIKKARRREIKKFQDPRRVEIFSKIILTDQQMTEIDKVYLENYGEKIPYTWHRHFTAYTGKFDPYYFPELLFIPEFERFMNPDKSYTKVLGDKTVLPLIASSNSVNISIPETYISSTNGLLRDKSNNIITIDQAISLLENKQAFLKPTVGTNSGMGCAIINIVNGKDTFTGEKAEKLLCRAGRNFIVQKCITCHASIRKIYAKSVNTFRIITYLWKGNVEHMPVIMRLGQGEAFLDNAHAGGMFIAVSDDGILHKEAFTEFHKSFTHHPNTGVKFEGFKIEHFPAVIDAAKKMHQAIPQVGCINWDFTIDETGVPVLIEGNMRGGSIWLIEIAHGCGAFGEHTPEILKWIRQCKSVSQLDRIQYAHGYMENQTLN